MSTYPLRNKLIEYSKTFNQANLKKYVAKYYKGPRYFNLNLNRYVISAHNLIEANVILMDFFNLKLKAEHEENQYEILQCILEDDFEENFDENGNLIFDENELEENDTLWLEEIDIHDFEYNSEFNKKIILSFQG